MLRQAYSQRIDSPEMDQQFKRSRLLDRQVTRPCASAALEGCSVPFNPFARRMHRVGFLASGTLVSASPSIEAFRAGLTELAT